MNAHVGWYVYVCVCVYFPIQERCSINETEAKRGVGIFTPNSLKEERVVDKHSIDAFLVGMKKAHRGRGLAQRDLACEFCIPRVVILRRFDFSIRAPGTD